MVFIKKETEQLWQLIITEPIKSIPVSLATA
jgi:hypothetical protein